MKKLLSALLIAGLVGCSVNPNPYNYNLDKMPRYDQVAADKHYEQLAMAEAILFKLKQGLPDVLQQLQLTDVELAAFKKSSENSLDKYYYWYAVGMLHLFNGNYDKSNEASIKAIGALSEIFDLVDKLADAKEHI